MGSNPIGGSGMRNTTGIGQLSEAAIILALTRAQVQVYVPLGHSQRADLVIEVAGRLYRVQCKTGRYQRGGVEFNANSRSLSGTRDYRGQIEYFGVYCPPIDQAYLVPVGEV